MSLEFQETARADTVAEMPGVASERVESVGPHVLEPHEVDDLVARVAVAVRKRRRKLVRGGAAIAAYAVAISILMAALLSMLPVGISPLVTFLALYAALVTGVIGGAVHLSAGRADRKLRQDVEMLAAQDDVRVSGALIDTLYTDDRETAETARQALIGIMARWTEGDVAALTADQRRRIRWMIHQHRAARQNGIRFRRVPLQESAEFRVAVCRTLGRLGDAEDLRALRQYAAMPAVTVWAREVRQAAREAIPVLEARLAEQNRPHTLLRASTAPVAAPEELLRATSSSPKTPSNELLRPESTQSTGRRAGNDSLARLDPA